MNTQPFVDNFTVRGLIHLGNRLGRDNYFRTILCTFEAFASNNGHMHSAWEARDFNTLRLTAHRLKGSSLTVGAAQLARSCSILQTLADSETGMGSKQREIEIGREMAEISGDMSRTMIILYDLAKHESHVISEHASIPQPEHA